jgi:hypothetical protein
VMDTWRESYREIKCILTVRGPHLFSRTLFQVSPKLLRMSTFWDGRWTDLSKSAHARNKDNSVKKPNTIVRGLLAAPVLPAAYMAVLKPLGGHRDFISIVVTFIVVYMFAATGGACVGTPIFLLLNKYKLVSWWLATCSGALVSAIVLFTLTSASNMNFETLSSLAIPGAVGGFVFWIFWRIGK